MANPVESRRKRRPSFEIAGHVIKPGKQTKFELPIARLMSSTQVALPVLVSHGHDEGPTIWLNAAIHGDELCGVEIIRRVLHEVDPGSLAGTIIAVPVVNVHGFNNGSRYLPDRRDLNRSFPGSLRGSLASRIARLMMTEVVSRCSIGIDLHTGSDHRINLPQIRADLDDPGTLDLARAFAAPVAIHSPTRQGSLRFAATKVGATVLLYEAGEADRFDDRAIRAGTAGTLKVLERLGMIDGREQGAVAPEVQLSRRTRWVRAPRSGIFLMQVALGEAVVKGQAVGTIQDLFGRRLGKISARTSGMIVGHTQRPLVNRGDAIIHIAELEDSNPELEGLDAGAADSPTSDQSMAN